MSNGWEKTLGKHTDKIHYDQSVLKYFCKQCSNQFNTMELLINHISKHHKKGKHPMLPVSLGISAETAFIKPHKETQLRDWCKNNRNIYFSNFKLKVWWNW